MSLSTSQTTGETDQILFRPGNWPRYHSTKIVIKSQQPGRGVSPLTSLIPPPKAAQKKRDLNSYDNLFNLKE